MHANSLTGVERSKLASVPGIDVAGGQFKFAPEIALSNWGGSPHVIARIHLESDGGTNVGRRVNRAHGWGNSPVTLRRAYSLRPPAPVLRWK